MRGKRFFGVVSWTIGWVVAGSGPARAEVPPRSLLLEVSSGPAARDDHQEGVGAPVRSSGDAWSRARVGGSFYGRGRLGGWLTLSMDRFALSRDPGAGGGAIDLVATDVVLATALAARASGFDDRLRVEGLLGYAYRRLPAVSDAGGAFSIATVGVHGPLIGAQAAGDVAPWLGFEARTMATPQGFGGSLGSESLTVRHLEAGGGVRVGRWLLGGFNWAVVADYAWAVTNAEGGAVKLSQRRHQFGLGVRLSTPAPARFPAADSTPPLPVKEPAAPVIRGSLVASSPSGTRTPLGGATVTLEGGETASSDSEGRFALNVPRRGPVRLRVEAPGFKALDEVIAVPESGDVTLDLVLEPAVAPAGAVIRGLVRSEGGVPLAARLRIPQLGLAVTVKEDGTFLLRVPAGRYTLKIEARGYVGQEKEVQVTAGDQAIFDIDLQKAAP